VRNAKSFGYCLWSTGEYLISIVGQMQEIIFFGNVSVNVN